MPGNTTRCPAIRFSVVAMVAIMTGCQQPATWTPPPRKSTLGPPPIYRRTPQGLVPINATPDATDKNDPSRQSNQDLSGDMRTTSTRGDYVNDRYTGTSPPLITPKWADTLSQSGTSTSDLSPIQPQYYYIRGEHTPGGYIRGQYRREGNFTRGEQTTSGYIPGNYRGDGNYTRGEYTPNGYIRGHYRAEPQPIGVPYGTVQPPPRSSPGFARPIGGG